MQKILRFAVCAMMAAAALYSQAQDKPLWAGKSADALNKERTNDSYELKMFNTYNADHKVLRAERFNPLFMYVRENYSAQPEGITLDSIATPRGTVYTVGYTDKNNGSRHSVRALRIDEYCTFDDFESNDYEWDLYQLFAIGRPDIEPQFDEFEINNEYNGKATVLSIVPGLGQSYKNQKAKGFTIMGAEAVLLATGIAFQCKLNDMSDAPEFDSKRTSYRNVRTIAFGAAAALYIYNLIDAAVSKGPRHVVVKKAKGENLSVSAVALPGGAAMGLRYTF